MTPVVFVGREAEQARLSAFLQQALSGKSQIAFITGEAGEGKTTLARNFAQSALSIHPDLLIAFGSCSAQSGLGDPYLPFREVLAEVMGLSAASTDSSGENSSRLKKILAVSGQVLLDLGPDLVGTLLPGAGLIGLIGKTVVKRAGWMDELEKTVKRKSEASSASSSPIDQNRIFEQYANVLQALAKEQPLLLMLDDLQWADEASISLLFHLSRRLGQSPVMILGTYRPEEVAAMRGERPHPLAKVLLEIKRSAGDVWVNLAEESQTQRRAFLDQLLDSEPNQLDQGFRQSLFHLTGGQALFSVEVLRTLQEQGHVVKDQSGRWVVSDSLDWETLPARVEGVIEERIARLEESQQELLRSASVEGERFTAEVLAEVQQLSLRNLLKELSQDLEKVHRLVIEQPVLKIGGTRLASYRFSHALFRKFLYEQLGQAERGLLHAEVAKSLEKVYAASPEEICVQLAWHFEQAGEESKAAEYSLQAGRRALSQGAPKEAARFFERALEWLPEEDLEGRWRVALEHNTALVYLSDLEGWKANIQNLHALARALGDSARVAEVFNREANLALSSGEYGAGLLAADQAVAAARLAGDTVQEALGHHWKVLLYTYLGQFVSGRQAGELALALARASGDETVVMKTLRNLGHLETWAGYPARGLSSLAQSLEIAQRLGDHRMEQGLLLGHSTCYGRLGLGLAKEARASFERGLEIARRIGLVAAVANSKARLGEMELLEGNLGAAKLAFSESHAELVKLRQPFGMAHMLMFLGIATERLGDIAEAAGHFAEALKGFQQIGGNPRLEMQCRAGLARCALALGQTDAAHQQAAAVWQEVMAHDPQSFAIPAQVYLACADVFAQTGDQETAKTALEIGYRVLIDQAYQIDNPEWRKSFLENIPEHRELLTRWGSRQHRDDLS